MAYIIQHYNVSSFPIYNKSKRRRADPNLELTDKLREGQSGDEMRGPVKIWLKITSQAFPSNDGKGSSRHW